MRARRSLVTATIAAALFGAHCADGFREDEMDCEQAVAHLESCCGAIDVSPSACTHESDFSTVVPTALTASESQCILGESCDGLRSSNVCDRARVVLMSAGSTVVCP